MRVFYWREKIRKSEYFSQFLGAYKFPRGFLARENFGNKKASKTAARKKKKPMVGGFTYDILRVCRVCPSLSFCVCWMFCLRNFVSLFLSQLVMVCLLTKFSLSFRDFLVLSHYLECVTLFVYGRTFTYDVVLSHYLVFVTL